MNRMPTSRARFDWLYRAAMKLGFIGCGMMGQALLKGFLKAQLCQPETVIVLERNQSCIATIASLHCTLATSAQEVTRPRDHRSSSAMHVAPL
jgi:pyrroline-5-carboxylate reductase